MMSKLKGSKMKNNFKKFLIFFAVIALFFMAYQLILARDEYQRRRASDAAHHAKITRISDAQKSLAKSLAICAAETLNSKYLTMFITHELMPLGLAWQLARLSSLSGIGPSLENIASNRLSEHFNRNLDDKFLIEQKMKMSAYHEKLLNGEHATVDRFPSLLVYRTFFSEKYRKEKPEDIQIGENKVDWPNFIVLAKKCKATPFDLIELSRDSVSISNAPLHDEKNESFAYTDENYMKMKRIFWVNFSQTAVFIESLNNIKSMNNDVIKKIIDENESIVLKERAAKFETENLIFKTP